MHSTNSFSIGRVGSVGKSPESEFRKSWHASSAPVDALFHEALSWEENACECLEDAFSLLSACSHGSCCSPWGWVALASSKSLH